MAITLYSGTPGSGKSLNTAYLIIDYLKTGKNVIANFPVDMGYFKKRKKLGQFFYIENFDLNPEHLKQHARLFHKPYIENQTLIVIDECSAIFNTRAWNDKDRQQWISFFQIHRHFGYEVVLISQSDKLIDKQIRAFIEYERQHRCITNYGWVGILLHIILLGKVFVSVHVWYHDKFKLASKFFRVRRRKANIYNSYKMRDDYERDNDNLPSVSPYIRFMVQRPRPRKKKKKR